MAKTEVAMKRITSKVDEAAQPIWCDHCQVRIAPYEAADIVEGKALHKHCVAKSLVTRAVIRSSSEGTDFGLLPA